MSHYEAVLFDLDGTLLDSNQGHCSAFSRVLSEVGGSKGVDFLYERFKGMSTPSVFRALLPHATDDQIASLTQIKRTLYLQLLESGAVPLFPGARELVELVAAAGARPYLVTSASRSSVERVVEQHGLKFAGTVCADDVVDGKPAAAPYLMCIRVGGLDPSCAIAVEDAEAGILSADAAGLDVLVVGDLVLRGRSRHWAPDLVSAADILRQRLKPFSQGNADFAVTGIS
jgi:HAD superfamily hydrolase (TIGR01509 family)